MGLPGRADGGPPFHLAVGNLGLGWAFLPSLQHQLVADLSWLQTSKVEAGWQALTFPQQNKAWISQELLAAMSIV